MGQVTSSDIVRWRAADPLGPAIVELLKVAASDEDAQNRRWAIEALVYQVSRIRTSPVQVLPLQAGQRDQMVVANLASHVLSAPHAPDLITALCCDESMTVLLAQNFLLWINEMMIAAPGRASDVALHTMLHIESRSSSTRVSLMRDVLDPSEIKKLANQELARRQAGRR